MGRPGPWSVSYTHLDVYKRQGHGCAGPYGRARRTRRRDVRRNGCLLYTSAEDDEQQDGRHQQDHREYRARGIREGHDDAIQLTGHGVHLSLIHIYAATGPKTKLIKQDTPKSNTSNRWIPMNEEVETLARA